MEKTYDAYCPNCGINNGEYLQGDQVTLNLATELKNIAKIMRDYGIGSIRLDEDGRIFVQNENSTYVMVHGTCTVCGQENYFDTVGNDLVCSTKDGRILTGRCWSFINKKGDD